MSQLKFGAVLSYVSIFISIFITLLYTPVMIRLLGQTEYGLYSMIGSISAYLSIMDLGLGNAIVRYVSRNRAIGDKETEANLNGMFLILYSIIGIITILVGIVIYNNVDKIFGSSLSSDELFKGKIMILILIVNFSISFPLSIFGSIMQAYERFIMIKSLSIFRTVAIPLGTLPFLFMGFGSIMMVLVSTFINIVILFFNLIYCYKYLKIKIKIGKINLQLLKEIISYSFFIFLGIVVDQINWNTGQIILGAVSGTITVAVFAIAIQFVNIYLRFSTALSGLFLPRVSIMVANNASNIELTKMMVKFGRIQYIILSYILTGFIIFGYQFISIWAGENYSTAFFIAIIIMIPITVPLVQNFGLAILQAKNLQGFRSVVLIFIAIINVIISIPLAKIYGGIGVAIGTALSYIIGNGFIMNLYYNYKIKLNISIFWKNILKLTIPAGIALIIGSILKSLWINENLLVILIGVIFYSLIFFVLMWLIGFNNYEKSLLILFIKKIGKFFCRKSNLKYKVE